MDWFPSTLASEVLLLTVYQIWAKLINLIRILCNLYHLRLVFIVWAKAKPTIFINNNNNNNNNVHLYTAQNTIIEKVSLRTSNEPAMETIN